MVGHNRRNARRARPAALAVALLAVAAASATTVGPARADAPEVSGEAYGHYTTVSLFGGPQRPVGPSPRVSLPGKGSATPITAAEPDGGSAVYGPAHVFGGRWPLKVAVAPPSGPVTVSTKGKAGAGASVTSTADIVLYPKPRPVQCDGDPPGTKNCTAPGGFGPVVPNEGDELHATCTATEAGVSGSARFVNAVLSTSTDESGEPKDTEPIPDNPPPNYTRTGTISNVGDNWKIVYNEQFIEGDGSITVNALHMYMLGQIAVGEQILGHVRCSMRAPTPAEAAAASSSGPAGSEGSSASSPAAATKNASSTNLLPFGLAAAGVVAVGGAVAFWSRRRVVPASRPPGDGPG